MTSQKRLLLVLALAAGTTASAASFIDVQANNPQVQGDLSSNSTAVFPTNKQNEPTIAVNPTNASILLAGANDEQRQPPCGPGPVRGAVPASDCSFFPGVGTCGIYRSTDGGVTWRNLGLLDDQPSWVAADLVSDSDPVIVFGPKPDGTGGFSYANGARAYYSCLASYKPGRSPFPPNALPELMTVSYSDDNGTTWSAPVIGTVKPNPNDFNDKESLWVDNLPASPYFGRAYLTWTEFRSRVNAAQPVMVAVSTDGGITWSAPKQLSPASNNGAGHGRQGSAVRTGADGVVYVAWEEGSSQVMAVSENGGDSWSRPVAMGPVADLDDPIPGSNFRTDSFPSIATHPSTPGTVYGAWANRTSSGGRVVVVKSSDDGATWSAPVEVSTAAEGYAFFQGLNIAPNGRVDVGYQSLQAVNPATFGTGNAAIHSYYVNSVDGGASWSAPLLVSTASSDPAATAQNNLARQFFGDYNTLVSTNATAWFIYTDSRNGVGCAALDEYQRIIAGTSVVRGDFSDRLATRLGLNPYSHEPGDKPAPSEHCGSQFGNSDIFVSRVTP